MAKKSFDWRGIETQFGKKIAKEVRRIVASQPVTEEGEPVPYREDRPERGLTFHEALERFVDPELPGDSEPDRAPLSERAALEKRAVVLFGKLKRGDVISSGIAQGASSRTIVDPSLFELLMYRVDLDAVVGHRRIFEKPEFFLPAEIPLNVRSVPKWLLAYDRPVIAAFAHDARYRKVSVREERYALGEKQSRIIKVLHEASQTNDPWRDGRSLLDAAGSESTNLMDLFKNKRDLIVSDGTGLYRLKLD
ncbi:hypothetical protein [Bauldia litoralis]|uniref:Uncharacterized protein n=1 Tax=Bauldia litoralis TaxID=665467 RepID=A0A1G6EQ69_9HYPH|nr:hypothetical protein [Bauldia litoralis]SDB59045.1 hypothetical protein SAMN02982931_04762 [Bauldia litoralis]